ncbi:hypothetical protein GLOIN_2v1683131 [Rhizophagus irregularis DAOM 181602=DAOM 197198]|uniref:Uncharacterized protein n=1 Tax=Rhizophagus irregularis (strain DAOM 181602 / DAOM 197198 / MUCL 43194) TaxID=747089 RepID=A0A2P4PEA3_RHIID|nr:hypothetical protein GLOIN_2v1683131 [Rhizophagus irregularis DAOM 181602=DAOM 197198]POG63723.1 hypothetical protein GLOIN_2v1683131 [Rhizophagus irregularis DAOM 181602=DAOM 197198]|eukprot:XP_025170589.1 hypothetical protein GLOIN_2v1683131 [Rhizophagus irregularis DAOM 181602=DAOM 197198]
MPFFLFNIPIFNMSFRPFSRMNFTKSTFCNISNILKFFKRYPFKKLFTM